MAPSWTRDLGLMSSGGVLLSAGLGLECRVDTVDWSVLTRVVVEVDLSGVEVTTGLLSLTLSLSISKYRPLSLGDSPVSAAA